MLPCRGTAARLQSSVSPEFMGIQTLLLQALIITTQKQQQFQRGLLIYCVETFMIIRGLMTLFHKYLKVPCVPFNYLNFNQWSKPLNIMVIVKIVTTCPGWGVLEPTPAVFGASQGHAETQTSTYSHLPKNKTHADTRLTWKRCTVIEFVTSLRGDSATLRWPPIIITATLSKIVLFFYDFVPPVQETVLKCFLFVTK